jgi:DNA helicase HerA-like ATPase
VLWLNRRIAIGATIDSADSLDFQRPADMVEVDASVLARGAVIVGKSGTGKSNDIQLIAMQLAQMGTAVVLLDRTGEHAAALHDKKLARVMVPGKDLAFSILAPADDGIVDFGEAIEDILDTLSHYFSVSFDGKPTPLQQRIIRENLRTHYHEDFRIRQAPTISEFIGNVSDYEEYTKRVHGFIESSESVISRLHPLTVGKMGELFNRKGRETSIEEFFAPGVHVVDLSVLRYEPAKTLLSQFIVKKLYHAVKRKGIVETNGLRQLIAADEAHHLAPRSTEEYGYLDLMAVENRKYGQGVLVASTSPAQLSEVLLRNASLRICHQLDDGKDIELMLRFMVNQLETDRYISDIRELKVGEAVLQSSLISSALTRVKVSTPPMEGGRRSGTSPAGGGAVANI